eukprot:TRINITY_DN136729_c0_g1_i1.p1 TRINITY_DN136729_c0_g1~~TRINITY_DN136729_c0_g1_i1.p1  ORF type:complete len:143 (-),score=25.44 TRINITY_DN136729_c0_g1_i1:180-608(-)
MPRGVTVKDVNSHEFVNAYSKYLKRSGKMNPPEWTNIAKTACYKELSPQDPDWFYIRTASLARKVYLRQNTGLGGFKKLYGSGARNGTKPRHHRNASGSVIRHALKQLTELGIIEVSNKGGRKITQKGQRELDGIAVSLVNK